MPFSSPKPPLLSAPLQSAAGEKKLFPDLPEAFLIRMQEQLGEEYPAFLQSYENKRSYGLRIHTRKISPEKFEEICPFEIRPVPWIRGGYFYEEGDRPSRCPLYQAGLYYLQDPGAMVPASLLPVAPGDRVLDLCAAPGGKATALADKLGNTGLLAANDISNTRAKALLRNLELSGSMNTLVLNEDPEKLAKSFAGWFDKILLDAPCSGEGMFRKDPSLASDWTADKSKALSKLQKRLIHLACLMLRPGGMLLYSTCTFSREENEDVILSLLSSHPEMQPAVPEWYDGFSHGLSSPDFDTACCVRIYPHRMDSEGQFAALLKKEGISGQEAFSADPKVPGPGKKRKGRQAPGGKGGYNNSLPREAAQLIRSFFDGIGLSTLGGQEIKWDRLEVRGSSVYYVPSEIPDIRGLTFLRNGLFLGELKKNRFEPSNPFALALLPGDASSSISLPSRDPRLLSYLQGNPIPVSPAEAGKNSGFSLLAVDGFPLAFGKLVNGQLKNKIPAGWRT